MTTPNTALVVDDNFFNRDICAMALRSVGYQVFEAQDGTEVLNLLRGRTFDLMLLDLRMPATDGSVVLRALRRMPQHRNMRIVVITANPELVTDEIRSTATSVMFKPINVNAFVQMVQQFRSIRDGETPKENA